MPLVFFVFLCHLYFNYGNDFDLIQVKPAELTPKLQVRNNLPSGGILGSVLALLNDQRKVLENISYAHNVSIREIFFPTAIIISIRSHSSRV